MVSLDKGDTGQHISSVSFRNTELKYQLKRSAVSSALVEVMRTEGTILSVAIKTCCGILQNLVLVLKNDQKRFGLEYNDLLIEAKKFSRLTLINFLAVLQRFLYFSMIASTCDLMARRSFRRNVSFFNTFNISPVSHGGLFLPLMVF